jgi:hypothetical protein
MWSFTGMRDLMEFKPGKHRSITGDELLRRKMEVTVVGTNQSRMRRGKGPGRCVFSP